MTCHAPDPGGREPTINHRILDTRIRAILDSRGRPTIEAEVTFADGASGRGSTPVAIAPGHRERKTATVEGLRSGAQSPAAERARAMLRGNTFSSQAALDRALEEADAGANIALALSLAFCRACASEAVRPLHRHFARLAGLEPAMPHLAVNIFSGGIHSDGDAQSFQQIMLIPELADVAEEIEAALAVFHAVERRLGGKRHSLSASSGIRPEHMEAERLLVELREEIDRLGLPEGALGIGIDVAAEHLATGDGRYRFEGATLTGEDLLELVERLTTEAGLIYVEDPFAPADRELWAALCEHLAGRVCLVGDDLFATSSAHLDPALATGILLKMSQAGTVSATLDAARAARAVGLDLCVSHRSGETEDTGMCDLAVGVGARYVKVGGPRRGDRIAKYNQLLRLAENDGISSAAQNTTMLSILEER